MFRSNFDKSLESATSHLLLEPNWPAILSICDSINQQDVTPKNAFAAIKKKMSSPNPHSALFALMVLESVVKNCGTRMHEEVFTKENCEMFSNFLEQTPHENVRQKMLELVQTWANAFRTSDKYQAIKDTMTILKTKGHTFPELKEADAMFAADLAPTWADGKSCHRCRREFTMTNRKHHCRNCGQVFCGQCTTNQCPLPKFGIEKMVRVCDGCFVTLQKPALTKSLRGAAMESDLPAEYLNSSLAQQVQTPPRKSEQELNEEEELQLALALSQSEAEQKKQQQQSLAAAAYRMQQRSPSPEAPPASSILTNNNNNNNSSSNKDYQQEESNPDLAKYLNRSYWEQRKVNDSPMASPSAPSPMPTPTPQQEQQLLATPQGLGMEKKTTDEQQIDDFANNMRTQVEIFVNRMKSNSSRGRSISTDSSVQTLFMTLTTLHSQQLSYIKEMDDKRMWYEQLQDKLAQIKDSRDALDLLRQEHKEKLRLIAEEQERQRQMQMAQKLDIMRKKKQEYLQYQRQLALQRIQEQEREMQLRQEQQKAQYRMGQTAFPFMPPQAAAGLHNSPSHQLQHPHPHQQFQMYAGFNPNSPGPLSATGPGQQFGSMVGNAIQGVPVGMPGGVPQGVPTTLPGMYTPQGMPTSLPHNANPSAFGGVGGMPMMQGDMPPTAGLMGNAMLPGATAGGAGLDENGLANSQATSLHHVMQQQQQHQHPQPQQPPPQLTHVMLQHQNVVHTQPPIPTVTATTGLPTQQTAVQMPPQQPQPTVNVPVPPPSVGAAAANVQIQAVAAAPAPPKTEPEPPATTAAPAVSEEPATAELISFD